jgi:hypothetical protein
MADKEREKLCAKLTGPVADVPADVFYKQFNLDGHSFSEYYLKDMMRIFYYQGMEQWPKTLPPPKGSRDTQILMSLVCFMPTARMSREDSRVKNLVCKAHEKASQMVISCFDLEEDHSCIQKAMDNYPTLAIFMSTIDSSKHSHTGRKPQRKSILDDKHVSCLAAVTYFRQGTHTQVLWLATTLAQPPVGSIHVVWQKIGLGTYLLCMLVKQHTGISDNLDHSVLSLQASPKRGSAVRRYYMKLGFISQNCAGDNGFLLTSHGFQNEVIQKKT